MPCPVPSHLPTPPSLSTLLEELAALDPARAEAFRANVTDVELRQQQAREQIAKAESALSLVKADGTLAAQSEWNLRFWDVSARRKELRLLGVDADCLRGALERQFFLARQSQAIGRAVCSACGGTGDDEGSDGGTAVVVTSCEPCRGTGYVPARSRT